MEWEIRSAFFSISPTPFANDVFNNAGGMKIHRKSTPRMRSGKRRNVETPEQ